MRPISSGEGTRFLTTYVAMTRNYRLISFWGPAHLFFSMIPSDRILYQFGAWLMKIRDRESKGPLPAKRDKISPHGAQCPIQKGSTHIPLGMISVAAALNRRNLFPLTPKKMRHMR